MSQRSIVRLTGLSWKSAVLIATKASPQITPKMTTRMLVKIRRSLRDLLSIWVSSTVSEVIGRPLLVLLRTTSRVRLSFVLYRQQRLLPLQSPGIAAQTSIFPDHSVARDHDRNRVCRTCPSYCPRRLRRSQRFGYVAVCRRLTVGNRLYLLPDLPLKRSSLNV